MEFAAVILVLFSCFLIYLAFYQPKKNADTTTGEVPTKGSLIGTAAVLIAISFVMFSCSKDNEAITPSPKENNVERNSTKETNPEPTINEAVPDKTLNMSAGQFQARFNQISKLTKNKFYIDEIVINDGEINNVANVLLNKNCSLILVFNKANVLKGVTSVSTGDGTIESGLQTLQIATVIFRTFNKSLPPEAANNAAYNLWKESANMLEDNDAKTAVKVVDGIQYYASASDMAGIWFGAEPAQ